MLKGVFFTLGLVNGAHVGIRMRDAGFAQNLTKSFYNDKRLKTNPVMDLEPKELNALYDTGLLDSPEKLENFSLIQNVEDLERMQEILNKEMENKLAGQAAYNNRK